MVQNSKLLIEKFSNGITLRWNDLSGKLEPEKSLAVNGEESNCIGESLWDGIRDLLGQSDNGKVEVTVEIRTL